MAVDPSADERELQRAARAVLASLRAAFENPYAAQYHQGLPESAATIKQLMLDIEASRIPFLASGRRGYPPDLAKLARDLEIILHNGDYASLLRSVRFRLMLGNEPRRTSSRYYGRFSDELRVNEALIILIDMLRENDGPVDLPLSNINQLRSIVPDQKIAPLQFDIRNRKITIVRRSSFSRDDDQSNIAAAKRALRQNGESIIGELERSNCDKRLVASMKELQAHLEVEIDAIKIGLLNLGCEMMCGSFAEELPTAVASMLRAHTRGVQMFVGQFPEWNRFVENAAAADIDRDDIAELRLASMKVAEELKSNPDLADPEVPKTLAFFSQMLESPGQSGKRAAFAVLRSLENLFSRVYSYGVDYIDQTAKKAVADASSVTSKVIVGMLLLALTGATAIGPITGKIPDMNWLRSATDIMKKQLQELTGEK